MGPEVQPCKDCPDFSGVRDFMGEPPGENTESTGYMDKGISLKESGHFSAREWQTVVHSCSISTSAPRGVLDTKHRA